MKRFVIILFTAFYASLSMGVELNLHYCGGSLAAVTVALPAPSCCCDADNLLSECCKDAQLSIQMDVDQANRANPTAEDISFQNVLPNQSLTFDGAEVIVIKEIPNFQPNPPPIEGHFLRIEMGSLTFYG